MTGTEKQVKWAEELRANVINTFERLKAKRADSPAETAYADKMIEAISKAESASSIINLFRSYKPNGDIQHDVMLLVGIYRNAARNEKYLTDEERRIVAGGND